MRGRGDGGPRHREPEPRGAAERREQPGKRLPEAARPKASPRATHEPARRAHRCAGPLPGCSFFLPPRGQGVPLRIPRPQTPAWMPPRASGVAGGVRRGARGGRAWRALVGEGSVPWTPSRHPRVLHPLLALKAAGRALLPPLPPAGRLAPPLPQPPSTLRRSSPIRGRAFPPGGAGSHPGSPSPAPAVTRGPELAAHRPLRTRGAAASTKKRKTHVDYAGACRQGGAAGPRAPPLAAHGSLSSRRAAQDRARHPVGPPPPLGAARRPGARGEGGSRR